MNNKDIEKFLFAGLKSKRRLLGELITLLESEDEETLNSLDLLYPEAKNSFCLGITGPPGAGKSTLTNRLIEQFKIKRTESESLAVLAVDPSSPFTGGAFLGDRVRFKAASDDNIFTRSLANRGALGGLSAQTPEIVDLIEIAGFNMTIIETVGVGQSEVEIAKQADLTLVVLHPEAGDSIQALKAGLMEIADIIVINKADRPQAEEFSKAVEHALHLKTVGEIPPVYLTSAQFSEGIIDLYSKINEIYKNRTQNSAFVKERKLNKIKSRLIRRLKFNIEKVFNTEQFQNLTPGLLEDIMFGKINFNQAYTTIEKSVLEILKKI